MRSTIQREKSSFWRFSCLPVIGLITLHFLSSAAHSEEILETGVLLNDGQSMTIAPGNVANSRGAVVFTTGNSAYRVTDAIIRLSSYKTTTPDNDVAQVGFFLDNGSGTNTGAQLGNYLIAPSSINNNTDWFDFVPNGSLILEASTKYWMVVSESDPLANSFNWRGTNPFNTPSGVGATFNAFRSSSDGTSWTTISNTGAYDFHIHGLAGVPEPASLSLLGLGILELFQRRRV